MSAANAVDAEDILKLFSLYLIEHGEKLLTRAHQFMNVTHIYPYSTPSNNNTKEPLRITNDFLTVCGVDPCLMNDYDNYQTNPTDNNNNNNLTNSRKETLEVEKSILERWWERRKKIHSEWMEKYLHSNGTNIEENKSPFALDENPLLTMISNVYFHHLMNKLRYDSLFGMVNHKVPNSKILKMKYKILRILNARVKEFKRKQKEKKSFFSWFVEQIVDNEFITELTNTDFERFIYIFKNIRVLQLETNKTKKGPMQSNKTEDVEVDLTLFHNLKHLIIRSNFTRLLYIKGKFITNDETAEESIFKTINLEGLTVLDSQFLRIERNIFHDFADTLRVLNLISIDEQLLSDIFLEPDEKEEKTEFADKSRDVFRVLEVLNISNVWFKKGEVPIIFSKPSFVDLLVNKLKVFILKNTNLEISIFDAFNGVGKHFVLSHLMILNLSHNNLHTILRKKDTEEKNCITVNLPNLIELNLAFNELESLDSFHGVVCPKLEIINLEKNQLNQGVAENLRKITANTSSHLKRINLRSNQLTAWQEIKQLQFFNRLHDLQLNGNEEICRYGNYHRTILSYFRRNITEEFVLDGTKYLKKDIMDILNLSQTGSSTATDTSSQNGSMSDTDGSDADIENDNFVDLRKQIKKSSSTRSLIQEEVKQVKEEKKKKKKEGKNKKSKKKKRVFNEIPEYKKDAPSKIAQSNPEEDAKKVKEEFPELEERSTKVIDILSQLRNDGGTKWLSLLNEMGYLDEKNQQITLTPKQNLTEQIKKTTQNKDKQELEDFMNKLKKNSSHNKAMNSLSDFLLGKIKKKSDLSSSEEMVASTPRAKNHQQDFFASMDLKRISRLGNKQMPVLEVHPVFGIADTPNFEKYGATEVGGLSFIKSKGTKYGSDALIAKSLNLEPRNDFLNVSLVVNQSIFKYGEQEKSDSGTSDSDKRGRIQKRHRNIKQHYSAKIAELKELEKVENETSLKISDEEIQNINSNRKRNKGVFLKSELEKTAGAAVGSMINKRATINIIRRKDTVKQPEASSTPPEKKFSVPIPESNMQKYLNDDDLLESLLNEKNEDAETKKRKESVLRSRGRTFISPTTSSLAATGNSGNERDRSATQFSVEPKKEQANTQTTNPITLTPITIPLVATAKKEVTPEKPPVEVKKAEPIEEDDDDGEDDILKELLAKNEEVDEIKPVSQSAKMIIPPLVLKENTTEPTPKTPEKVKATEETGEVSSALQNAMATSIVGSPSIIEEKSEIKSTVTVVNAAKSDSDFDSFDEQETLLPGVTLEKLKIIAPFNDPGQSSDSDFGTFSGDDETPRSKKSGKPSSSTPKQHEKVNSMPIINLASDEPKGRSKSKSVFKMFKKKDQEVAQIKNRSSVRIPKEERDFLASTLSGVEFGPITSSTTFASLKLVEEPKKDDDSDFDLTDDEEQSNTQNVPPKHLDENSFETNTPTKDEPETPQEPIQEEPKVSSPITEDTSTPTIEPSTSPVSAISTKKVISNIKKIPNNNKETPTTPLVASSPTTPSSVSVPTTRKSFVISSKKKKAVAFSDQKEEFVIESKNSEENQEQPIVLASNPVDTQTESSKFESYDDEGYGDELTTNPVIPSTVTEDILVQTESENVATSPVSLLQEKDTSVTQIVNEEVTVEPVSDNVTVEDKPTETVIDESVSIPVEPVVHDTIPVKIDEPKQELPTETPNEILEIPVETSTIPQMTVEQPVIIPMEDDTKPIEVQHEEPEITTPPTESIHIEENKEVVKPENPSTVEPIPEPIVESKPVVSAVEEPVKSEIITNPEPIVIPDEKEPIEIPIVDISSEIEPTQEQQITIPQPVVEQVIIEEEPFVDTPQISTETREETTVETPTIPQNIESIIVEPKEVEKPVILTPEITNKEEAPQYIPETIQIAPTTVDTPIVEFEAEPVPKQVLSSTATSTPNKDIAVISPALTPSPAIEQNEDDTEILLKELLAKQQQQSINDDTEYDDEETILPQQPIISTSQVKTNGNTKSKTDDSSSEDENDEMDAVLSSILKEQKSKSNSVEYDDDDDDMDSLLSSYAKEREQEKPTTTSSPTVVSTTKPVSPISEPLPTNSTTTPNTAQKVINKTRRNAIGSFSGTAIPTSSRKRSTAVVIPSQRRPTRVVKTVDDLLLDDSDDE